MTSFCASRKNSLTSRLPRLRSTARLENLFAAIMPSLGSVSPLGITLIPKLTLERRIPLSSTALNCAALPISPSGLALGIITLGTTTGSCAALRPHALNAQASATLGPPRAYYCATSLGFHACPESVGTLSAYFRWLVCSLHVMLLAVWTGTGLLLNRDQPTPFWETRDFIIFTPLLSNLYIQMFLIQNEFSSLYTAPFFCG